MAIDQSRIARVENLMLQAALQERTVPFRDLYSQFPKGSSSTDVYDTLEAASANLASFSDAIYSAVLAKKGTGVPGDGFFDMFKTHRNAEYAAIAGSTNTLQLTLQQKEAIVAIERPRVYAHAKTWHVHP